MRIVRKIMASERGYLFEIPLLVIFVWVIASLVLPFLKKPWDLILIGLLIAAVVVFLIYNFFLAGWLPGKGKKK